MTANTSLHALSLLSLKICSEPEVTSPELAIKANAPTKELPKAGWQLEELLAILQGGEPHRFLELHGEGALVVEAQLHCDAADGRVLFAEQFAGFVDAHLDDVLLRGEFYFVAPRSPGDHPSGV